MVEIVKIQTAHWIHFYNPDAIETKRMMEAEYGKPNHGTLGKYLFFSDDKHALMTLAHELLSKYNLYSAKVPKSNAPKPSPGFGFVLCVYDSKPHLTHELKQYADEQHIRYRYWKSDADTLKEKYSKEFSSSSDK